jgi:hypothetical protein
MPKANETTPRISAIVYFLNNKGDVQQADMNSDVFIQLRNTGKLFVIAVGSNAKNDWTIVIPAPHLEAIAQSEHPNLLKIMQELSHVSSGESKTKALFDIIGLDKNRLGGVAEKLLKEITRLLQAKKPHSTRKVRE